MIRVFCWLVGVMNGTDEYASWFVFCEFFVEEFCCVCFDVDCVIVAAVAVEAAEFAVFVGV